MPDASWRWRPPGPLLLVSLLLVLPVVADTTVYRSVDAHGVVSFSDQPPQDGAAADVLYVPATAPPADPAATLQALRETNDRMARARREREAARARTSPPRVGALRPAPVSVAGPGMASWPGPQLWPYRLPRGRPAGGWRPPVATPSPVPPGFQRLQPGNEQLMRPIVSSRE